MTTSNINELEDISSQDEQSTDVTETSDENHYVFILNDEGQHVLKKKSEVEKLCTQNANETNMLQNSENISNHEFMQNVWNQETSNGAYKDICPKTDEIVANIMKDTNLWNIADKNNSQTSNDSILKHFNVKEINIEFSNGLWHETSPTEVPSEKSLKKNQSIVTRLSIHCRWRRILLR